MMAGAALIVIYLIIVGGAKGIALLIGAVLLFLFWPAILLVMAISGVKMLEKLKSPLGLAFQVMKDLLKHMLRPPDR